MATLGERHLLALPQEVLLEICSHLCWHSSGTGAAFKPHYVYGPNIATMRTEAAVCQAGLDALGRTCTLLRGVAHSLLYRGPCITRPDGLGRLMQTLARRPALADAVVELYDLRTEINDAALVVATKPEHVDFHDTTTASLAVVVLSLLPNLVRAHLRLPAEARFVPGWLFPRADATTLDEEAALKRPCLRVLALSSPDTDFQLALDSRSLFQHRYLANLEHLHIHGCRRILPGPAPAIGMSSTAALPQPLLHNLLSLALTRMVLSAHDVRQLLTLVGTKDGGGRGSRFTAVHIDFERPPTLLQEYDRNADGSSVWAVQLDEVLALCYPWRNSLTSLSFHREDRGCHPLLDLDLSKLREYSVLSSLSTEACFLRMFYSDHRDCLTRLLPMSIQRLRLFGSGYPALSLEALLDAHRIGQFPHLRVVVLDALDAYPGSLDAVEFDNLARAYQSAGLVVRFEDVDR